MSVTQWSYSVASEQAEDAATQLQRQCQTEGVCPTNSAGWNVDGKRISRRDLGNVITGGIDVPVKVERYFENQ